MLVALLSPAAAATLAHCGGATRAFSADASATDGAAGDTTTTGDDGGDSGGCVFGPCDDGPPPVGPFAPCSATRPDAGSPCTTEGELCEYGADFFIACDRVFVCGNGVWRPLNQGLCTAFPDGGDASCPATWSAANALVDAGVCPALDCEYAEGTCACLSYCGSAGQAPKQPLTGGAWECKSAVAACPSPRPRVGTACDTDAGCDYGWPCGCGTQQGCVQGVWRGGATPVCP
jgi:hypothetical protein